MDVPLQHEARLAVETLRAQFDHYVIAGLQVKAVDDFFLAVMAAPPHPPQPHKFRSMLGDFLARGEYDLALIILKSLRRRCVAATITLSQQEMLVSEFNDLLEETQSAAVGLTGCKLPVPVLEISAAAT